MMNTLEDFEELVEKKMEDVGEGREHNLLIFFIWNKGILGDHKLTNLTNFLNRPKSINQLLHLGA